MVKRRMAMRMITIFVALIVCGMFFPDPAVGNEYLSSDKGFTVKFENLQLNEPSTIPVVITNVSDHTLKLIMLFNQEADCNFEYGGPSIQYLGPGDPLTVNFTYTPSDDDACTAELQILYSGSDSGVAVIALVGDLEIAEVPTPFEETVIGGFRTGVLDRMDKENNSVGEMIGECEETAYNHGQCVRCIVRLTRELRWEGTISFRENYAIRRAAAKAAIHNIIREMKRSKRSKKSGRGRFLWRH
jgi:hypothetical protein